MSCLSNAHDIFPTVTFLKCRREADTFVTLPQVGQPTPLSGPPEALTEATVWLCCLHQPGALL